MSASSSPMCVKSSGTIQNTVCTRRSRESAKDEQSGSAKRGQATCRRGIKRRRRKRGRKGRAEEQRKEGRVEGRRDKKREGE
eukprot:1336730-Rhodomonas_salina.1